MGCSGGELEHTAVELRYAESELGHTGIWLGSTGAELGLIWGMSAPTGAARGTGRAAEQGTIHTPPTTPAAPSEPPALCAQGPTETRGKKGNLPPGEKPGLRRWSGPPAAPHPSRGSPPAPLEHPVPLSGGSGGSQRMPGRFPGRGHSGPPLPGPGLFPHGALAASWKQDSRGRLPGLSPKK